MFALLQTSSPLFLLIQFVNCYQIFLGLSPKGLYLSLEKEKEIFSLCSCSGTSEKCTKSMMCVQKCSYMHMYTHKTYCFFAVLITIAAFVA